ncbi:MAG TPA: glycosyltransferase family 9 protein [Planctomycetota bacterium]|nr:glycosyltransferase family 9 protein [Planctomycetota bacterium]
MADAAGRDGSVLLVRLSAIGDVLQCLPALAELRAARPAARLHWLVEDRCASVLRGHPHLDGVVVFDRRALSREARRPWLWPRAIGRVLRLRKDLRALRPDAAVDLQGNLKGALLARLSGAPRRIGLAPGQGGRERGHWFATERVVLPPPPVHRGDRARALIAPLGLPPTAAGTRAAPAVAGVDEAGAFAEEWLRSTGLRAGGFAVFHPGVSGFGDLKRWPAARWADLARALRDRRSLPVVLTAGPGEAALADEVAGLAGGAARRGPATESLAQLGALLRRAAVAVGSDTGPVHLAAVLGTPTVALFGPKDPAVYAPRGPRVRVVWKQVWCSPCRLRRCGDPVCMTEMRVDEVLPAVEAALAEDRA